MILKRIACFSVLIIFLGLTVHPAYSGDRKVLKVIVNVSNKIETLSAKEISLLFLKKVRKWDDGSKVLPVDRVEDSPTRKIFSDEILGRKISAIEAFWQKQIFTGRGVPPPEKNSDKEVLKYVEENNGAIGYISSSTDVKGFKVKEIGIAD